MQVGTYLVPTYLDVSPYDHLSVVNGIFSGNILLFRVMSLQASVPLPWPSCFTRVLANNIKFATLSFLVGCLLVSQSFITDCLQFELA